MPKRADPESRSPCALHSDTEADTLMKQAPLSECLLNPDLEPEQLRSLKKLVIANRDIFNLSPKNPGVIRAPAARINTGDNEPASFPFRPTMPHLRPVVEEHLNNMLASGIIRHSTSPWGAALLIVPKKDGQVRITTDFRLLNDRTEKFCYPLPRVDDSIATLHGNKFFTAVDFTSAYPDLRGPFYTIPLGFPHTGPYSGYRCPYDPPQVGVRVRASISPRLRLRGKLYFGGDKRFVRPIGR